ncbi:MAG TPA: hypothetical protein VGM81_01805 [Burkholderiaceae bacterium]
MSKLPLNTLIMVMLSLGLGAYGQAQAQAQAQSGEAEKARAALTPKLDHACAILSAAEVSKLYGHPVKEDNSVSMPQANTCEFVADGHAAVSLTRMPARYYEPQTHGDRYRKLRGIGDKASISFDMGGWRAIASRGDRGAVVVSRGPGATQENAIALLKAVLDKGG